MKGTRMNQLDRNDDGFAKMWRHVASLPEQLAESFANGADAVPVLEVRDIRVCGMGGSAVAAELVSGVVDPARLRVDVRRDYGLGPAPDSSCLLVFSSYSGETEETLSAWDESRRVAPAASRVVISSGGRLAAMAEEEGVPWLRIPAGLPPRASLGHGVGVFCALLERLGEAGPAGEVAGAVEMLRAGNRRWGLVGDPQDSSLEDLAASLDGRLPILYSGCRLTHAVARRWRAQLNENSKLLVSAAELPELDHNEVVGWGRPTAARAEARVVALRDESESPRVVRRFASTREALGLDAGSWFERRTVAGAGPLARMLGLVQEGDVLSCLLARRGGVDPMPVAVIDRIKSSLADR